MPLTGLAWKLSRRILATGERQKGIRTVRVNGFNSFSYAVTKESLVSKNLVGPIHHFEAICFYIVYVRQDASTDRPQVELTTTEDKARSVEGPQMWNSQLEI